MALFDAHLKLGDVKGESKHKDHVGEIQLESFNFGANQSGTGSFGGGSGAGKVALHDIHCVSKVDKSSPFLFLYCANGMHIDDGKIVCRKAGETQEKFVEIELKEILISSCQFGASTNGDVLPVVQFSLNCAEISFEYLEQDKSGKTTSAGKKKVNVREMKFS